MSNEIKAFPTPGFNYRVKKGDYIARISNKAYGDPFKWRIIKKANIQHTDSAVILGKTQEFFQPGDVVFIPDIFKRDIIPELKNKKPDDFTFFLSGNEIPITQGTLLRTMDTGADAWTVDVPWNPGVDLKFDEISSPYKFSKSSIYLGGKLKATGKMYTPTNNFDTDGGRSKTIECFSQTADIIDSTVKPPYEKTKYTLQRLAEEYAIPRGIRVSVDDGIDTGGVFSRATANQQDKEFDFLAKLASQRGLLISNNEFSDLLITKAKTGGEPVATIEEGQPTAEIYSVKFDGRARFSSYRALSQTPKSKKNIGISTDQVVPGGRHLTFTADDTTGGDIKKAAAWKKNKILADALTIPFPVSSWYYDEEKTKLWEPNTLVNVKSKTIGADDGFIFLIRQVQYNFTTEGRDAELSLVPPQVYTLGDIEEPWLR